MLQMTRMVLLVFAMATLLLTFPSDPAHARFGDCTASSYPAQFDPRLAGMDFTCQERLRARVVTEAGERHIRLLHDRHAGWAASPDVFQDYERGIGEAVRALGQIGPYRMDDVTVLLIDGFPPLDSDGPEGFSNIAGDTGVENNECLIAVYLLAGSGAISNAAYVVAHEIFHCVQLGTLSHAQMTSGSAGSGSGGDWWLEGSADWFAVRAIPDTGLLQDGIAAFDRLSPDTPLYEMAYGAVVFFLWLDGERGPQSILPFLRQMAGSSAASAQRSAMHSALTADEWLAFAQAYLDQEIRDPDGGALPLTPAEGETWRWTETHTETVTLEPFVLHRGWIVFDCGRWVPRSEPDRAHAVRADDGVWGALPDRIDTQGGDADRYRFVGFAAQRRELRLRISGELEAGCASCGDLDTRDQCLVGTWEQSDGGPIGWMRQKFQGVRISRGERRNVVRVFKPAGTFWTARLTAELTMRGIDGSRGDGKVHAQTAGRWSAGEGRLNLCHDRVALKGKVKGTFPDGETFTAPIPTPTVPDVVSMVYRCSESALETRLSIPGVPSPIITQYRRTGSITGEREGGTSR